jgi:hypothetical protein
MATGMAIEDKARQIMAAADAWINEYARIEARRIAAKLAVRTANTPAEIEAARL